MHEIEMPQFLGLLVIMLVLAKCMGKLAQLIGQPAVLGELGAGVLLGLSVAGLVDPHHQVLHVMAELGVLILLFEIGLETDLHKLMQVGIAALVVACAGVVFPFGLGYAVCWMLGLNPMVSLVAAATLTATSVGITARVLSDLNRLQDPESQIILGAAVIDDVIGLIILTVVAGMMEGQTVTTLSVLKTTSLAVGFLISIIVIGKLITPILVRSSYTHYLPGTPTTLSMILAFGLAWLAVTVGSAMIIGAFAAGLLLHGTPKGDEIEHGIAQLGHLFVPIFFVMVGAAVDISVLNPLNHANWQVLMIAGLLLIAAVIGKFLAGHAPFWFNGNKNVIGAGMIPRGEVGLIFAQMGMASGVFDIGLYSAVTLVVMLTTFIAPPLLKALLPPIQGHEEPPKTEGITNLVTEA